MENGWKKMRGAIDAGGFVYNDLFPVTCASYVTRKWPDEPLWLMVVAPPGTGKSATMGLLTELTDVKLVSAVTPAALISGWGGDTCDRSLFNEIKDGKLLCAKDFGTILNMGWATANVVFSLLREAFDGNVSKQFGMLTREYRDIHFNMVAAATDVYEQFRSFQQHLGERFLRYSLRPYTLPHPPPSINPALRSIVAAWLTERERVEQHSLPAVEERWLHDLASLICKLRTEVVHDSSREVLEIPGFEGPTRLEKQLTKLCRGLAVLEMDEAERHDIILHTAASCVSPRKMAMYKLIWDMGEMDTIEVAEETRIGYGVVRRMVNDAYVLKLIDRKICDFPKTYSWDISEKFKPELAMLFGQRPAPRPKPEPKPIIPTTKNDGALKTGVFPI